MQRPVIARGFAVTHSRHVHPGQSRRNNDNQYRGGCSDGTPVHTLACAPWGLGMGQLLATENFERTVIVSSDVERSWALLTDVHELVSWVRILHSAQEIDHLKTYTAVLEDKVGPFALRADLAIEVKVLTEGAAVDVVASGRDRAINSQIDIEGSMRLTPLPSGGTQLTLSGKYQVTGRATSLGAGMVRKKGDAAVEEFLGNAIRTLGPAEPQR
jgi:carbon monoxide dehydrogenase subunit G